MGWIFLLALLLAVLHSILYFSFSFFFFSLVFDWNSLSYIVLYLFYITKIFGNLSVTVF